MLSRSSVPLCGLLFFALVLPAAAQDAHSQSDEDACRPDVFRLCASQIPDEDAIVACLHDVVPQLSPACRAVIAPKRVVATPRKARRKT